MTYTTLLAVDVPVDLMSRLDEMARAQHVTRATLVRGALASFAGVEILPTPRDRSNRDGRESEALAIIKAAPHDSIRELVERLRDAGIHRSKDWVCIKRRQIRREA